MNKEVQVGWQVKVLPSQGAVACLRLKGGDRVFAILRSTLADTPCCLGAKH